jgi:hypothetical protein
VQTTIAVSRCTAKKSFPCGPTSTHGKDKPQGNYSEQRTAKNNRTAYSGVAHGKEALHGKA